MADHTPGPWHYQEESDAYTHIVRGPTDNFIVQLPQDTSGRAEANARLIAAAPAMLEALQAISSDPYGCVFCDSGALHNPSKGHEDSCGFFKAQTAIALATGADAKEGTAE